jgi:hypothetical protein
VSRPVLQMTADANTITATLTTLLLDDYEIKAIIPMYFSRLKPQSDTFRVEQFIILYQ